MTAIERIRAGDPQAFWRDYVVPRKPVIITDLVAGFPHATSAAIVDALPDAELVDGRGAGVMTLRTWWQTVERAAAHDPSATAQLAALERVLSAGGYSARHTSTDIRVPASLFDSATRFRAFHAALLTPLDRDLASAGLGPNGAATVMLFLGHPGVTTPLHVDGWIAQTFNTQLSGHKEWFLIAPDRSAPLGPSGFTYLIDPMRMPFAERTAFADTIGAYSFVVGPGETLYFPHHWVHGTAYPEPSFSFVQHFGRDLCTMFVSREVHRTFTRHAVMQKLYPGEPSAEFVAIHDACKREHGSPRERFDAIDGVLRTVYEQLFPEAKVADLPFEMELIRELEETRGTAWYAEGGPVAGARAGWTRATGLPLFDWWR